MSKFYGMGCFMGINMILLYLVGLLCVNVVYNLEYKLWYGVGIGWIGKFGK